MKSAPCRRLATTSALLWLAVALVGRRLVALALAHERAQGQPVTVAGRHGQPREIVHRRATILGNLRRPGVDYPTMDCERIRLAISAGLDGEDPGVAPDVVTAHLAACAHCREFETRVGALHRQVRVTPAPEVPDLTPRILSAIGASDPTHDGRLDAWRVALAFIAVVQIAIAVPALLLGSDAGLPVHTARHLGSFSIALAVGFLFAAWRPSRVSGLFPVAAALVACLLVTSIIDLANGRASAAHELSHVTELLGLALLWLISRASHRTPTGLHSMTPGSV